MGISPVNTAGKGGEMAQASTGNVTQGRTESNGQTGQSSVRHSMEVPLRGKPHPALRSHLPLGGEGWDWGSDHRTKGAAIIAAGRVRRDCRPDNPGLVMSGVWWYTGTGMKGRTNRAWKWGSNRVRLKQIRLVCGGNPMTKKGSVYRRFCRRSIHPRDAVVRGAHGIWRRIADPVRADVQGLGMNPARRRIGMT